MSLDKRQYTIPPQYSGQRLDKVLSALTPDISRNHLQAAIDQGLVEVNRITVTKYNHKVYVDDYISLSLPITSTDHISANSSVRFDILYEDEHVVIINKPAGLTCHPGAGNHNDTLVNGLIARYNDQLSPHPVRPGIVHRLDRDTSGVMIVAKTQEAHYKLGASLAARQVKRIYYALVYGSIFPSQGTINTYLSKSRHDHTKVVASPHEKKDSKKAITHYRTLEQYAENTISLIECTLETGRTHQIRVHLSYKGHPLIGDAKYRGSRNFNLKPLEAIAPMIGLFTRQALHAYHLTFPHPITGEELSFSAPLPLDILELLTALRERNNT